MGRSTTVFNPSQMLKSQLMIPTGPITVQNVEYLAENGVSKPNILAIYQVDKLTKDEQRAFDKGRAIVAARTRAVLIDKALDEGNIAALTHLDKLISGDVFETKINLNVERPLMDIPNEQLLDIVNESKTK